MPEFGPYEQPGWPSTLPYFQPGKTFQNAFLGQQAVNLKTRQLENQLAVAALRNQQMQFMDQLREKDFERKTDQFRQMMAWRDHEQNNKDLLIQNRLDLQNKTMDQIGDMATGFSQIDLAPDDPKRPSAIWDVIRQNTAAARYAPRLAQEPFNAYNHAVATSKSALNHDETDFARRYKDTLGRGQSTDMDPLYHPEIWKTEYRDKQGNLHGQPTLDDQGKPVEDYAKGWTPTDQRYVIFPDTNAPNDRSKDHYVKYPKSFWDQMRSERLQLDKRKANIGDPVTNEYTTAIQPGVSRDPVRVQTPAEAQTLQPGTVYITPDGRQFTR